MPSCQATSFWMDTIGGRRCVVKRSRHAPKCFGSEKTRSAHEWANGSGSISRTNQTDTVDWSCSSENAGIIVDAMALLRLAEWVSLSKPLQGCSSCRDKTPPRADQAEIGSSPTPKSLETPHREDATSCLHNTDQDGRSSTASSQTGAER